MKKLALIFLLAMFQVTIFVHAGNPQTEAMGISAEQHVHLIALKRIVDDTVTSLNTLDALGKQNADRKKAVLDNAIAQLAHVKTYRDTLRRASCVDAAVTEQNIESHGYCRALTCPQYTTGGCNFNGWNFDEGQSWFDRFWCYHAKRKYDYNSSRERDFPYYCDSCPKNLAVCCTSLICMGPICCFLAQGAVTPCLPCSYSDCKSGECSGGECCACGCPLTAEVNVPALRVYYTDLQIHYATLLAEMERQREPAL